MNYSHKTFGKAERRLDWRLREQIEYRRNARLVALTCAAVTLACVLGAGLAAEIFGNVGGAAVLGLVATLALMLGAIAASEA